MNFDILKNLTQISYLTVLYYHMPPQISRLRWRITTQVTFEWLFSAVSVCPRRCLITWIAFLWLTSSVWWWRWWWWQWYHSHAVVADQNLNLWDGWCSPPTYRLSHLDSMMITIWPVCMSSGHFLVWMNQKKNAKHVFLAPETSLPSINLWLSSVW